MWNIVGQRGYMFIKLCQLLLKVGLILKWYLHLHRINRYDFDFVNRYNFSYGGFSMKMIAVFHNKGGVGKSTLLFHTSCALAELGYKVLMMDLDPQSNLSLYGLNDEELQDIWEKEEVVITDGFPIGTNTFNITQNEIMNLPRTIHFLLKPVESGVDDYNNLPPAVKLNKNLHLIPGRITLSQFEGVLADRWNISPDENVLAIRTITQFRTIATRYAEKYGYEYVFVDVSPSLGLLNRAIITSCDAFFMPATPDLFSMYGIRNIGQSLEKWKKSYQTLYDGVNPQLKPLFTSDFVKFAGYTIYNARGRKDQPLGLAKAHRDFAERIPEEINEWILKEMIPARIRGKIKNSIGGDAVWSSHNTYPTMAQKYKCPMWMIPSKELEEADKLTVNSNRTRFLDTQKAYYTFANDLLDRIE